MALPRRSPLRRGRGLKRSTRLAPGRPLESRIPLERRTPLSPMSPKRAGERDERKTVRQDTFARDGFRCVAGDFVPGVPCSEGLECDEAHGRGRRPGSHLDRAETQSLCPLCHRIKTDNPRTAGLLGLYGVDVRDRLLAQGFLFADACSAWAAIKASLAGRPRSAVDPGAVLRFIERRAVR